MKNHMLKGVSLEPLSLKPRPLFPAESAEEASSPWTPPTPGSGLGGWGCVCPAELPGTEQAWLHVLPQQGAGVVYCGKTHMIYNGHFYN